MNDALNLFITVGGWIGAAEFLIGYFLVSKNKIAGDSLKYQALNLSGAVLLLLTCVHSGAWPSVISNVFSLIVGVNVLLTVKRAYIAQLTRSKKEAYTARRSAKRERRLGISEALEAAEAAA